jgi:uncharacterized damage-inducible protein DinB
MTMRSTPQAKKEPLIAGLVAARQAILEAAAALPPDKQHDPFLGHWAIDDLVAHLAGWDHANLEGVRAILDGRLPAFYAQYDADWRTFNAGLVAQHKRATLAETLAEAEISHRALVEFVNAVPAEEIFRDHAVRSPRGRRVTIEMLLSVESRDERKHAGQVMAFAGRNRE